MRTIATRVTCATIVAFLALGSSTAQCATDGQNQCTNATVPDPLGLHKCLNTGWDLCNGREPSGQSPAKELVMCLKKSGGMFKLYYLLMEAFKDLVVSVSHLLPRGYVRVMEKLAVYLEVVFEGAFLQLDMHHGAPEGCKESVITIPEGVNMTRCVALFQAFCNPHHSRDLRTKLHYFLAGVACFLKKLRAISLPELLKEIACTVLTALITGIRETMAPPLLLFGLKLLKLLLNCETPTAILDTAERSLLSK